jgi:CRP/FNR family transcriptional regulator, nitrogen oxide reductase regulator
MRKEGEILANQLDIALIRDLPPFQNMDLEGLRDLVQAANILRVTEGSNVFAQGESAKRFFLLLDGHVRVVKLNSNGEQVVPRYISPGELLGIAVVLGLDAYPATAVAAKDCIVLSWSNSEWGRLIARYPTFATNTYNMVGQRLVETQEQVLEFATARVEQRVANAVLRLANQTGRKQPDGILIDFPVSRRDISEMTGTTLHTVSRLLSAWEAEGWIKSGRQKITLVNGHKIVLIANGDESSQNNR